MHKKRDAAKPQSKSLLVLSAVLLAATLSSCAPESTPPGADVADGTFEQAGYVFLRWRTGLSIMIWYDVVGTFSSGSSASTADRVYQFDAHARSRDGRHFDLEVQTVDGAMTLFRINDVSYGLTSGALFLVTTKDGESQVEQLHRDLSSVQLDHESIAAFARSDPDIAEFAGATLESQSDTAEPPKASATRSMKGYELYSWQMQGDWYFALVVGTNRIKTYDEISSPDVRVRGLEALKGKLDQLSSGEQVFWSERWIPNTVLPPDDVVEQVRTYCEQRGIQLLGQAVNKNHTSPVYVGSNGRACAIKIGTSLRRET